MVALEPIHMVVSLLATTLGKLFIVTVIESTLIQPLPSVPVTLYTVVETGLTVLLAPEPNPLSQL